MVSNYGQKSMDLAFNGLSTLEKHEVMSVTMYIVLCQLIPLTQLLQGCATSSFPIIALWETIKKTFRDILKGF